MLFVQTKMKNKILNRLSFGFTLVELLVVITIIAILTGLSVSSYTSAQIKARDSQRKSDLDQISKALMLYYADTGVFPASFSFGNSSTGFVGNNGIIYMRQTPKDPRKGYSYVYKVSVDLKQFNIFANLENRNDSQCQQDSNGLGMYSVDGIKYCYGVSSPNTVVKSW